MSRNALLVIADENQFAPAVFLADRLARLKGDRKVDIVLATNSPRELAKAREFGGPFELMDISGLQADLDLPPTSYFTRATYLSLFAPALLADRYDRLLYLDVDTYPESERVFALFDLDLDLGQNWVAAIRDQNIPFYGSDFNRDELMATLRIPVEKCLGAKYMNSGVWLMDLRSYRKEKFDKQVERLIRGKKIPLRLPDQAVFNALLRTRWLELSPSFNMFTVSWASFIRAFSPPAIVHFTGPVKPWHRAFANDHPVRHEIPAFLKGTPWSSFMADVNPPPQLVGAISLPPAPTALKPYWRGANLDAVIRYLRTTPFADVAQGLTTLDPAALPSGAANDG
jgi:lipopolysaccharide biosynthesis glycosyltransferase